MWGGGVIVWAIPHVKKWGIYPPPQGFPPLHVIHLNNG